MKRSQKKFYAYFLTILLLFSCNSPSLPKGTEEAFAQVVKILHAPYEHGKCFFSNVLTEETSYKGAAFKVGTDDVGGTGSYTVTISEKTIAHNVARVQKDHKTNTHVYANYQPKGSHIKINGSVALTQCNHYIGPESASHFNYNDNEANTCIEGGMKVDDDSTLKISGLYNGELTFNKGVIFFKGGTSAEPKCTINISDMGKGSRHMSFKYDGKLLKFDNESLEADKNEKLIKLIRSFMNVKK